MSNNFTIMDAEVAGMNQGIGDWLSGVWDINNVIPPSRFIGQEDVWLKGYASAEGFELIDTI